MVLLIAELRQLEAACSAHRTTPSAGYRECRSDEARKKRTISADASGPRWSVYEPIEFPPDQACPAPWTVHDSTRTAPSGAVWTVRVAGCPPAPATRIVSCDTADPARASRALTSLSALTGATTASWSPWKTISGMRP